MFPIYNVFIWKNYSKINRFDKNKKYTLSEMNRGIYLKPMVWVEIISELTNSSIVCLADRVYEKSDYIASKHEFIKLAKK